MRKADELAKAGAMLDEGMAKTRAKTVQQEKCTQPCSTQPVFAWWRNGKTVKSSSRSQKKKGFRGQEKRGNEASNGVVC